MKDRKSGTFLLAPAICLVGGLLVLPLAKIVEESFRLFEPGRIGSSETSALTGANYTDLLHPAYLNYFVDTFRFGIICSGLSVALGLPMAHLLVRRCPPKLRNVLLGVLIGGLFLNSLSRVYAIQLTLGPTGLEKLISGFLGISSNGRLYTDLLVSLGLLHSLIPISVITLIGTVQNTDPRLVEAAQSLGASRWRSHLTVTLPLSLPGLLSAFLISLTLCLGAFLVPLVLGKGKVIFLSNLIYSRFSEISNYPSGSAVAVVMVLLSLACVMALMRVARMNVTRARSQP
ncbi:ABC transporter permease subunit [Mesorhizobium sp.]|uniref:ABC transporter permease n=1 Tax=Mesorhizobium sp. TaxID=1871066 RepID=UPI000FE761E7|nr:ABC transporter permease subunit [Mesorhizobium sp.]RWJ31940.1 MAG: ABC transporter permease subunit [Mesorhizobium sp.]TIQ73853.1 MAG: ABC transporter permease subunit [Mesorhizobium sp.]